MNRETQCKKLLELLSDNRWHSNIEILNEIHIWRVSARIYDLKKRGYLIEAKNGVGPYYYYRLKQRIERVRPEPKEKYIKEQLALV